MRKIVFLLSLCFLLNACFKKNNQTNTKPAVVSKTSSRATMVNEEIKGLINEPGVRVREEASQDAKVVLQLDVGSRVEVIEVSGDWYKVAFANSDKVGWIKKSQLMEFAQWIAFNNQSEEINKETVNTDEILFSNFLILPFANNDKYANAGAIYQAMLDTFITNARFKIMSTNGSFTIEKQFKTKEKLEISSDVLQTIAREENIDGIVNGKISKADSQKATKWEVVIHVYQAKEGVLHAIEKTVIYEQDDDPKKVIEDMISSMINRLPYFAFVTHVSSDRITINQGKNVQLHPSQTLPIFRVTHIIRDPQHDTFVECDTVKVGTLRLETISDRSAEGVLHDKIEDAHIGFLVGPPTKTE